MKQPEPIGPVLGATLGGAMVAGTVSGALIGGELGSGGLSWVGPAIIGVIGGWFGAALHGFVLGVPAYLAAGRPQLPRWLAALAGAIVFCGPTLVLGLPSGLPSAEALLGLGYLAFGGALGGLAFRSMLRALVPA